MWAQRIKMSKIPLPFHPSSSSSARPVPSTMRLLLAQVSVAWGTSGRRRGYRGRLPLHLLLHRLSPSCGCGCSPPPAPPLPAVPPATPGAPLASATSMTTPTSSSGACRRSCTRPQAPRCSFVSVFRGALTTRRPAAETPILVPITPVQRQPLVDDLH
jgi:hypothetical protein